jgi:hypothetical protein
MNHENHVGTFDRDGGIFRLGGMGGGSMKLALEVILSLAMVGAWAVVANTASQATKGDAARAAVEVAVAASAPAS